MIRPGKIFLWTEVESYWEKSDFTCRTAVGSVCVGVGTGADVL